MDKKALLQSSGSVLRELRKSTGLSIFKVGRAVGVSGSFISQVERGICSPSDALLISLANLYHMNQHILFDLYHRLENSQLETLLSHESLRKTFTQITTDSKLSEEDLTEIANELERIAAKYLTPKEEI